jgi:uncharacterized delta-60 repeat protein
MKKHVIMGLMLLITATEEVKAQVGTLDQTFGSGGKVTSNFNGYDIASDHVIQADGKIVVVGSTSTNSNTSSGFIARYNTNGSLDNTFGTSGVFTPTLGSLNSLASVVLQSDGKIIAVGPVLVGTTYNLLSIRLNANGNLDNSFGINGIQTFSIGSISTNPVSVKLQTDGKIIIGFQNNSIFTNNIDFGVLRLNASGTLDSSFGNNGILILSFFNSDDILRDIEIQPDGKIIASGYAVDDINLNYKYALARINSDGSLDSSFGTNGKTSLGFINNPYPYHCGSKCSLTPNGKIIMLGTLFGMNDTIGLIQFNSNGSIDGTFGDNGFKKISTGYASNRDGDVLVQNDGKILICGAAKNQNNPDQYIFALFRVNPSGTYDNSFASNGFVTTSFGSSSGEEISSSVKLQTDGKIVVIGASGFSGPSSILLARYNSGLYTGLTEQPTEDDYFVPYPNPFNNLVTLNYTLQEPSSITIDLLDITGKIILSNTEQSTIGKHKKEILMPDNVKTGVYFIKIKSKSFDRTYKLIKN